MQLLDGRQYLLKVYMLSVGHKTTLQSTVVSCCCKDFRFLPSRYSAAKYDPLGASCPDYATLLEQERDSMARQLRGFQLFLKTYVYQAQTDTFKPVPGMPDHLPRQLCQALYALQLIETAGTNVLQLNVVMPVSQARRTEYAQAGG